IVFNWLGWSLIVGSADTVLAVAGEDVILPCSVKPNISVVDMRVEWLRSDLTDTQVHLYDDHEDKNTDQSQSYRGRTKLNHQELQRGDASLSESLMKDVIRSHTTRFSSCSDNKLMQKHVQCC
uniref:Immunoglobulin V-set domain-containing protein n=1 Tax=Cyprinus carpio carpio TaxID=630221 RepID=A0A8C1CGU3_CYPCA